MKRTLQKLLALALVVCLLAGSVSAALGSRAFARGLMLSDKTSLVNGVWNLQDDKGGKNYIQENYFVYEQESAVKPIVYYGDTLYGRSTMADIAKKVNAKGLTIVAGVNGSFFDLSTGIPYGIVITDGILRTSGNIATVGFYPDGTAIIGDPQVKVTVRSDSTSWTAFYNKALSQANGVGLYSGDYDTRTKNSLDAYHLILRPTDGKAAELRLNSSLTLEVTGIQKSAKSCDIPEGCFVLCIAESTLYATALEQLQAIALGAKLTVDVTADKNWTNVAYAAGGGDILVENGQAATEFELDSAEKSAPRTAVGIKGDGSIVLYTVDGGAASDSKGLTLRELAQRMREAGCKTALNLDGGGSTAAGAQYPGYLGNSTVNRPSDGGLRACANYIFLVRPTAQTAGDAAKLYVYPYDNQPVLCGARLTLTTKAVDANYAATTLPGAVTYTAKGGTVDDKGVLTVDATRNNADPYVSVTAQSGNVTGSAKYAVLDSVTDLAITREGSSSGFTKAMLAGGSTTELSAMATYYGIPVTAQDTCFTWKVTGDIGTVDADGTFVAAATNALKEGSIQVSYGSAKAEIAVSIAPSDPFVDMKGHWAKDNVNDLYFAGILAGSTGKDGKLYYRPDDAMTRQEFVVALMRYLKTDLTQYASVELPFQDSAKIASWAKNAIQAAYSLKYFGGSGSGKNLKANPTATITRQEAMAILYRTLQDQEDASVGVLNAFADAGKVSDWARVPVATMVSLEVVGGSNGKLNPLGEVTRAEMAKMLYEMWTK